MYSRRFKHSRQPKLKSLRLKEMALWHWKMYGMKRQAARVLQLLLTCSAGSRARSLL
jgi:hypothetical protein